MKHFLSFVTVFVLCMAGYVVDATAQSYHREDITVRSESYNRDSVIVIQGMGTEIYQEFETPRSFGHRHFLRWEVSYMKGSLSVLGQRFATTPRLRVYYQDTVDNRVFTAVYADDSMQVNVTTDNTEWRAAVASQLVPYNGSCTISVVEVTPGTTGYHFSRWNDGNTNSTRVLTNVRGDVTYTAYFVPDTFAITTDVQLDGDNMDNGSVLGAGRYPYHSQVSITAVPNPNYRFKKWVEGNDTTNPRIVTVQKTSGANNTYTAVFDHDTVRVDTSWCSANGPFRYDGQTFSAETTYVTSFYSVRSGDVDSIVALTVHWYDNKNAVTEVRSVCDSYTWRGTAYSASGSYQDTVHGVVNGVCDSIYGLTLTVNQSDRGTDSLTVCDSYTWSPYVSTPYTASGTYRHNGVTSAGCQVSRTLVLTVNYSENNTITATACDSYHWESVGDELYKDIDTIITNTGVYTKNYMTLKGCNGVDILNLTVNYNSNAGKDTTVCDSYTWVNHGSSNTYTASGTYYNSYNTSDGCPSVDTLHLTVYRSYHIDTSFNVCDSLVWRGHKETARGRYTYNDKAWYNNNTFSCDSVTVVRLTVRSSSHTSFALAACGSYEWHGTTYTANGTYVYNYTNASQCPSDSTLTLTVATRDTVSTDIVESTAPYTPDSAQVSFTRSGQYMYYKLASVSGVCDSVVKPLNLKIYYALTAGTASTGRCDSVIIKGNTAIKGAVTGSAISKSANVYQDSNVTVQVYPKRGYAFNQWSDGNTANPRTVTVTSDTNLQAVFGLATYHVAVVPNNTSWGSATGTGDYQFSDRVRIEATPNAGYHFKQWSDNDRRAARYITVDTTCTYTAVFAPDTFVVTVLSADPATGSATVTPDSVVKGASATLRATPAAGYHFTMWNDGNAANPRTVTPDSNVTYTAIFDMLVTNVDTSVCKYWKGQLLPVGVNYLRDTVWSGSVPTARELTVRVRQYDDDTVAVKSCTLGTLTMPYGVSHRVDSVGDYSYNDSVAREGKCDSIFHLTLSVRSHSASEDSVAACLSYEWVDSLGGTGVTYTAGGVYTNRINNAAGCDSILTLKLAIVAPAHGYDTIVHCERVTYGDSIYTMSTSITDTMQVSGLVCDSIAHITITVMPATVSVLTDTVCYGSEYLDANIDFAERDTTGIVMRRGQNPAGCDSIYNLTLKVKPVASHDDTVRTCNFYSYGGYIHVESGVYRDVLPGAAANGCDSTVTLVLTIDTEVVMVERVSACERYTWERKHLTYRSSTEDTVHARDNISSCDSVIRLILTVNQKPVTSVSSSLCVNHSYNNYGFTIPADSLTTAGVHTFERTRGIDAATTCDSLYRFELTVYGNSRTDTTIEACESYNFNGHTYTHNGNYGVSRTNSHGCDSVHMVHLVINHAVYTYPDTTVCDVFNYQRQHIYSDTVLRYTLTAANGCDSNVVFTVHVAHIDEDTVLVQPMCDSVIFRGVTYYASRIVKDVYRSVAGCDSIVNNIIHVNRMTTIQWNDTIPADSIYTFRGEQYNQTGRYVERVRGNDTVCDSVLILNLTVLRGNGVQETVVPTLNVYPNPTSGVLHITAEKVLNVEVLDIVGRRVARYENSNCIDLGNLGTGAYTLRITLPEGIVVRKVMKR